MQKAFFLVVLFCVMAVRGNAQNRDEFNGPFEGWADVKKQFGAKGNGKDDDTRAIQKAIDGLSNPVMNFNMGKGAYMVLYFPAGTYCISSTLVLSGKIGVSIIGENPANTIIKWIGPDKDTMLWANGSAYYRIARFTWDPNKREYMEGIGIHWKKVWDDGKTKSFASLNIEIADCDFIGTFKLGISGGTYAGGDGTGANDSEIAIKRCSFQSCWDAGIEIHGFNALDYWIWDCRFYKCQVGVKCSHGSYHLYRSYFSGSRFGDVHNDNGYYNSLRSCFSEGSSGFCSNAGVSCNPFKRIFQDNIVVGLKKYTIEFYHIGKITLWQNSFSKVQDNKINYWVNQGSWCPATFQIMSIKNTFETAPAYQLTKNAFQKFSIGDKFVPKLTASAAAFLKTMETAPVKRTRKVFEVPAGANSRFIQDLINQAAALKGQRPVIHFGVGTWAIDKTLVIPAGSDMQLIGDGLLYVSILMRNRNSVFQHAPLILVKGPTAIAIKDLQLGHESDKGVAAAIIFENVDQPAAQAHIDQIYSGADTSIVTEKQDYLYVEKNNSFFSDGSYLLGGNLTKQGKGTARVCCFGGQFAKVSVNNGARFLAKDCWWEGDPHLPLDLKGSGEVSVDGAMIAPRAADSLPTVRIRNFNGKVSLLNMYMVGSIAVDPDNPGLNLLAWNINFYHKMNAYEYIKPGSGAQIALLGSNAQCFDNREICKNPASIPDKLYRVNDLPGFLEKMTAFGRSERPVLYHNLPEGVSNIYISRVTMTGVRRGIVFTK